MATPPHTQRAEPPMSESQPSPGQAVVLTDDDLLTEVLIRLPTLADLGRACAVCAAFRRVVTGAAFLRRVRALHPPTLLGLVPFSGGFYPAEPPHRSAPFAHALARAANFRFSFLPSYPSAQWIVRDGRVLLDSDDDGRVFTKLAVCDPVFRRHLLLPPIPPDLAASVEKPHALDLNRKSEVFLAPSGEDGAAAETSFRVIWMAQCPTKLVAAVFSSAIGEWVAVAAPNWGDLKPSKSYTERRVLFCRSYAYGCFYWMMSISPHLLVFDLSKMEFSVLKLPSGHSGQESAIVEIREGKIGMFALRGYMAQRELDLFSTVRGNEGDGEWRLENKAILPYQYSYCLLGAANGELVLQGTLEYVDDDFLEPNLGYLSLKFSNLQCERVCRMVDEYMVSPPFLYIGSPPSLSSPSI